MKRFFCIFLAICQNSERKAEKAHQQFVTVSSRRRALTFAGSASVTGLLCSTAGYGTIKAL